MSNKPTIPAAQIQSDWSQTNTSSKDYIKNKPTVPQIRKGFINTSGIGPGQEINISITFSPAFSATPTLVCTVVCSYGYAAWLPGHIKTLTNTGAVYVVKNTTSDVSLPCGVEYIAML